jgi:hypothetical protein
MGSPASKEALPPVFVDMSDTLVAVTGFDSRGELESFLRVFASFIDQATWPLGDDRRRLTGCIWWRSAVDPRFNRSSDSIFRNM